MSGIHHVTAISGQAGRNLEFYNHIIGLRFVKKTVNSLEKRFGETVLSFRDADGTNLALVGTLEAESEPAWQGSDIPANAQSAVFTVSL
jgi:catechol 2,3-dioxygenase-like lactoylglutathione lyase family enzyme